MRLATRTRHLVRTALPLVVLAACSGGSSGDTDASRASRQTVGASSHASSHAQSAPGRTSCSRVLYIGESTSLGLVVPQQIPTPAERLDARMRQVGVSSLTVNVSGGRSSVERLMGRPSSMDVLTPRLTRDFTGCYVLALGVNDAANASMPGSAATMRSRIDRVMHRIGNRPVLWPLNSTDPHLSGPYANANMQKFDRELRAATSRYPSLRLYDWAGEVNPAWREGDGIHDTRGGSRHRALMYAHALAVAFPAGGPPSASTVVGSRPGVTPGPANRPKLAGEPGDEGSYWAADPTALVLYTSGPHLPGS